METPKENSYSNSKGILGTILKIFTLGKVGKNSPCREDSANSLNKSSWLRDKEKEDLEQGDLSDKLGEYQLMVKKEPWNPEVHRKLAKIYEKRGERQKAIAEYFLVAEIFFKKGFYPHAIEIYKLILGQDQSLDLVSLKIANTYQKMDLLEDAFSHYSQLLNYYRDRGMTEKAQEIMDLMSEFEQKKFKPDERAYLQYRLVKEISKLHEQEKANAAAPREEKEQFFDLSAELETIKPVEFKETKEISMEKVYGFDAILKELKGTVAPGELYPNFSYDMGMACLEMGFIDEAIVQFQMAIEKGQNPFEAAKLLETCFTKKGLWKEPLQPPDRILQEKGILKERISKINCQLDFIPSKEGNSPHESGSALLPVRAKA